MTCLNNLAKRVPLLFALVSFVLTVVLVQCGSGVFRFAALGQWAKPVMNLIFCLFALIWALLFFKKNFFSVTGGGIKYGFKKSIYPIVLFALLGLMGLMSSIGSGTIGQTSVVLVFITSVMTYICVGFFEEVTFRGFLLGGLLAKMGNSLKGVVWAIVISSVLFGFVHSLSYILGASTIDIGFITQVIGKTVETAMFGVFFAAIYLRTRSLWPSIIIHALTDFLQSFGGSLGTDNSVQYVTAGFGNTFTYIIAAVLSIPLIFLAVRMLKDLKIPCTGPLHSNFLACTPVDTPRKNRKNKQKLDEQSNAQNQNAPKAYNENARVYKGTSNGNVNANNGASHETASAQKERNNSD